MLRPRRSAATSGDAAFDLVTLAYYTYDPILHIAILDAARARTDPRALALYAAHMVLRQVDWSLHYHDAAAVRYDRVVRILSRAPGQEELLATALNNLGVN